MTKTTLHIEFTRPTKWFSPISWLIRAVQCTPYSHVRLRWTNTTDRDLVYHASGSSVDFVGTIAQSYEKNQVTVIKSYSLPVDKKQYRKLIDVCMLYANVKYSKLQVVKIGLLSLGLGKGWFTKDGEYAQVCSELVARVIEQVYDKDLGLDPDVAGPKEIDKALETIIKEDK